MFDLEKLISDWRKQMLAAGIKTPVPLEELEIHLREEIEQQMKSGTNPQQAFQNSVQRIGHAGALKSEFKKMCGIRFYMTREEIENCWKDPQNRKWGLYYCKTDPRVIVPRHRKWMGWTINFARPGAIPVLLFVTALLVVPLEVVRANGGGIVVGYFIAAASIVVVCLLSAYLSSSTRWSR